MFELLRGRVGVIVLAAILLRLVLFAGVLLYEDEAYYWTWSRRLAGGYFDHPPLVAWLIRAGSWYPGEMGLRWPFALLGGVTTWLTAGLALRLGAAERGAAVAALLAAVTPVLAATTGLALPDAPLLATWTACSWLLLGTDRRRWLAIGLIGGLALLSKYTAAFFGPAVLLAVVLDPTLRRELRTRWPWLGVLLALITFAPCLIWNAQHDWISFRFQLGHGFGSSGSPESVASYIAAVVGGPTPFVAIAGGLWLWRARSPQARRLLAVVLFPLAVFAYSSTRGTVEANWPALVFPALCAAAALSWTQGISVWERRWLAATATLSVGLLLVVAVELRSPHLTRDSPLMKRFHGWQALATQVRSAAGSRRVRIHAAYQDAAQLAWYAGFTDFGPSLGRPSQFDLWDDGVLEPALIVSRKPLPFPSRAALDAAMAPTRERIVGSAPQRYWIVGPGR